jgi:hypothetical protein
MKDTIAYIGVGIVIGVALGMGIALFLAVSVLQMDMIMAGPGTL